MKKKYRLVKAFLGGAALCTLLLVAAGTAMAGAPGGSEFLVKNGEWVYLKGGAVQETPVPYGAEETEAGTIHWLIIDPEYDENLKGEAPGAHFFLEQTGEYFFLSLTRTAAVDGFIFNESGDNFLTVEVVDEHSRRYSLYSFPGLELKFEVLRAEYGPQWVDGGRFVYSRYEPGTHRGMPEDYADEWTSVYVYDTVTGEETALKRATETASYSFESVNEEGDIVCTETSAESQEDWKDPENSLKTKEVEVSLPAAG